jgi:hypothetical protein
MKKLFLDIENTVIDDLVNCNFLEDNCKKISNIIKEIEPRSIDFFTWGWKTCDDININIVNSILIKLGKDPLNIGCGCRVFPKAFSVESAIETGWLAKEDFDRAIEPGMMAEFGISKISCFIDIVLRSTTETMLQKCDATIKNPLEFWLIDDLVEQKEELAFHGGILKIVLLNPKDLK